MIIDDFADQIVKKFAPIVGLLKEARDTYAAHSVDCASAVSKPCDCGLDDWIERVDAVFHTERMVHHEVIINDEALRKFVKSDDFREAVVKAMRRG